MPRAGRATYDSQQGWQRVGAAATHQAEEYHLIKRRINYFWQQRKKSKQVPVLCPRCHSAGCGWHGTVSGHQGQCNKANAAAASGAASPWLCCASTALCSLRRAAARPSLQPVLSLSIPSALPSLQSFHTLSLSSALPSLQPGAAFFSWCGAVPGSPTTKLSPSQDLSTIFGHGMTGRSNCVEYSEEEGIS